MGSGIYKIINAVTNKIYIGSAIYLEKRKNAHFYYLKKNKHHSIKLQNSFNKYGEENFKFEILELVEDKTKLIEREQYYFDILNPYYNICPTAGSSLGRPSNKKGSKITEEQKNKIRNSLMGRKTPLEVKIKQSESHKRNNKLKPRTLEHRLNNGKSRKGKPPPKRKCKYCSVEISFLLINRWHNENCKNKYTLNE